MCNKNILLLVAVVITPISIYSTATQPTVSFPSGNSMSAPVNQSGNPQGSDAQYMDELPYEDTFSETISGNKDDVDNYEQFKKLKDVIYFKRKESFDDSDSLGTDGYFLPRVNTDDKLQYGGVARTEQERYVNVIAIDANTVSTEDETDISNAQTDAKHAADGKFNPLTNPYIGTFIGQHDGKTYYLYGRYVNTIIPVDPLDANGKYPVENI